MTTFFYRNYEKNSRETSVGEVREQYERFPYPRLPLVARVRRLDTFLMNYEAAVYAAFGSTHFAQPRPRILVAGAGTFEPCVVALANPDSEILAVDISESSLKRLRLHLLRHGLANRVRLERADLRDIGPNFGKFDYIIATGVLHHLPRPEEGLAKLASLLAPNGVMRLMLYSRYGRAQVYRIQELCDALEIRRPAVLRWIVEKLPASHPVRVHFHLYSDSRCDTGIIDGFLHSCDHGFDASECEDFLGEAGLAATKFLHPIGSRPEDLMELMREKTIWQRRAMALSDWERLAFLDRLSLLETNFNFIAARLADIDLAQLQKKTESRVLLNPVVRNILARPLAFANRKIYSRLDREYISLGKELRSLARAGSIARESASLKIGEENLRKYLKSLLLLEDKK